MCAVWDRIHLCRWICSSFAMRGKRCELREPSKRNHLFIQHIWMPCWIFVPGGIQRTLEMCLWYWI